MNALRRALQTENLKMKRTLALGMALLTPAALVFLEIAGASQRQANLSAVSADINLWAVLFEEMFSIWVPLIFPLFITLETALLGQVEHKNNTWKLINSQPIPRWAILAAKQIWGFMLVAIGMLTLIALTVVGGGILDLLLPEITMQQPIPWKGMITQAGIALAAAGTILAIHTWIALRFQSFVVASAIGIGTTIAGLVLGGLNVTPYFPWAMPTLALHGYYDGTTITNFLVMGVVSGVLLSLVANWDAARMEVK
jgi:hypothetical protein